MTSKQSPPIGRANKTRRMREATLLNELQQVHGYALRRVKPKDEFGTMVTLPKKDGPKGKCQPFRMRSVRFVMFAVPLDSALGRALAISDRTEKKQLEKLRVKRSGKRTKESDHGAR